VGGGGGGGQGGGGGGGGGQIEPHWNTNINPSFGSFSLIVLRGLKVHRRPTDRHWMQEGNTIATVPDVGAFSVCQMVGWPHALS
jgi:hypothetical protein